MGAEREDTDPNPKRVGTEPGLGKGSVPKPAVVEAADIIEEELPPPVDFDALHAALGDPMRYDELPHESGPDGSASDGLEKLDGVEELFEADEAPPARGAPPVPPAHAAGGKGARVGESSGRSSATYASARPHTIPPTRSPSEDLNAPPVIVATDDTVPSAPPQMTVPISQPTPGPHGAPYAAAAMPAYGAPVHGAPISHPGYQAPPGQHPSSGSHPSATPALTPQPFAAIPRGAPQMTMRMPDRPINPRRGKTPTIVVRRRGPTPKQQLVAFVVATMFVLLGGAAIVYVYAPHLVGIGPQPAVPSAAPLSPMPSASSSVGPSGSSSAPPASGAAASASAPAPAASSSAPSPAASALAPRMKPLKPVVVTPPAPAPVVVPAPSHSVNPNAHF